MKRPVAIRLLLGCLIGQSLLGLMLSSSSLAADTALYFASSNYPSMIRRVRTDGTGLETLIQNGSGPALRSITIDASQKAMYYTDSNGILFRANLDGTGAQALLNPIERIFAYDLAIDEAAGFLYFAEYQIGAIGRVHLDGTGYRRIIPASSNTQYAAVAIDPLRQTLYYTDIVNGTIQRSNLDGSDIQTVISGIGKSNINDIAVDPVGGMMYFIGTTTDIMRADLNGGQVTTLFTSISENPRQLAIDSEAGLIYWGSPQSNSIRRAKLDGSDPGVFLPITTSGDVWGLAFGPQTPSAPPEPPSPGAVPEPSALLMLGVGLAGLYGRFRRQP